MSSIESQQESSSQLTEQQKIEKILEFKAKINSLISNIRDSKVVCDKYESDIQYFQEYIGLLLQKEK